MLIAMTVIAGVAAPALDDYVEDAKLARATHDAAVLSVSLFRLFDDAGFERAGPGGWATYDLLVGAGEVPRASGASTEPWTLPLGARQVGHLDDQLLRNTAGYRIADGRSRFGWRGAYIQRPVGPDPWGHRFAVNVGAMRRQHADTFVLSAGPDGINMSPFEQDGLSGLGDDIISLVSSGAAR